MLFVRSFKNLKRLFASTDKLFASPLLGVLAAMIVLLSSVYAQNRSPLHLEKEISLPGAGGVSIISLQMFAASACLLLLWRTGLSRCSTLERENGPQKSKDLVYSSRNGGVTTIPPNSHPESFQ